VYIAVSAFFLDMDVGSAVESSVLILHSPNEKILRSYLGAEGEDIYCKSFQKIFLKKTILPKSPKCQRKNFS